MCGKLFSDEAGANEIAAPVIVPKTAHTLVKTEAVAPTCTKEGSEAYWTCSGCGKLFSDGNGVNEIAAPVAMSKTAIRRWRRGAPTARITGMCAVCAARSSPRARTPLVSGTRRWRPQQQRRACRRKTVRFAATVCAPQCLPQVRPHRRRATRSMCGCLWDCCASVRQGSWYLPVCN